MNDLVRGLGNVGEIGGQDSPVTMYWESPEKAQPHIQPRDDSPGLLLLMLSSVIREKLDVLQILHVWSAEQVARSLGLDMGCFTSYCLPHKYLLYLFTMYQAVTPACKPPLPSTLHARGVRAEAALQGIACVGWDLGLGDKLSHLVTNASCQVPDIAVSL